jgi:hypothetical protein
MLCDFSSNVQWEIKNCGVPSPEVVLLQQNIYLLNKRLELANTASIGTLCCLRVARPVAWRSACSDEQI